MLCIPRSSLGCLHGTRAADGAKCIWTSRRRQRDLRSPRGKNPIAGGISTLIVGWNIRRNRDPAVCLSMEAWQAETACSLRRHWGYGDGCSGVQQHSGNGLDGGDWSRILVASPEAVTDGSLGAGCHTAISDAGYASSDLVFNRSSERDERLFKLSSCD